MSPSGGRPRPKRSTKKPARAPTRPAARKPARPARAPTRPAAAGPRKPAPAVRAGALPSPRDGEAPYRALFDYASDGILITETGEHRFIDANLRGCEMLGYTREELLRMRIPDLIPPEDLAAQPVSVEELRPGRPVHGQRRLLRKDGTVFDAEIGSRLLPDGRAISILRDIGEIRQNEQALWQSEARYRAVLEQATDAIFVVDAEGRFLDANPRGCELVGYPREELLQLSLRDTTVAEDLVARPLRMKELLEGRALVSERPVRRKDGSVFTAEISARGLADGRIVTILRDVTEQRRAEQALADSEARYRGLYESMRDAFVIVDMDGWIRGFNEVYRVMLGYEREELFALTYRDITPDRWHAFEAGIVKEQILPRGYSEVYEKEYRRKDGTVFPVELRTVLLRDEAGAPASMWATVRDVSVRQQTEQALRESEGKYRAVVEQASDGIFVAEGKSLAFVEVNPSACEMLGYAREELLGMTALQLIEPQDLAVHPVLVNELGRKGPIYRRRPVVRKDGSVFVAEMVARILPDGRFMAVVRDVTERERADQALRESEARNRALFEHASDGIFVSDPVTHAFEEVNSHACEMLGYTQEELLQMTVLQLNDPQDLAAHPLEMKELGEGSSVHRVRRLVRKDGTVLLAAVGTRQLPDGRVMSIVRDVTERERVGVALRLSEARSRALFEHASDGIFISDAGTHRYEEVNQRACEMLGYAREELLRMTVLQVNDPQDLAAHPLRMEGLREGATVHGVRRLVRKDGTIVVTEVGARQLPDGRIMSILRDVTVREQAADALRESEARYRAVVEQASDGITITDPDWRLLDMNPRFCELVGYSREELLRMSVREIGVPEDLAREPLRSGELAQGRKILTERRMRRKDGSIITAEISARSLADGTTLSVVRDVTERRRADQALRESEERFRRVFESEMLGMVFGMQGGGVADANDYFLHLVGYNRNDLLAGRVRWNAIMPPERGHLLEEAVRQAHATGSSPPFETEFIRQDGVRVPVLCGAAFLGASRDFGVGFALDLTDLKRTEQRLAESERYLERAQALAHVGTWDADLTTMTAIFSDEMLRIYGRPPGSPAVPYAEFIASIHPDDRAAVEQNIREGMAHPGERRYEHRVLRPDGSVRVLDVTSESVLDAAGRPTRIIGSIQDITERRFLELQLREAQKLEAIGRLAGGVAHDFNNLLTVILGFTETLLDGLPAQDERRATAEQIRTAGRRAAGLTQQLLAFGRRQVFRLEVFDLNVVLAEMRDILQQLIGERIEIVITPAATKSLVRADRGQLEQVILNLALNARDAMPAGGRLGMATSDVEPPLVEAAGSAGDRMGGWLLLAVSDTGTGMSPEVQAHIFEPFFTTKEVGRGTGLGLATVYGIVSQTGGRIEVDSAPGAGTTLRVFLPCAAEAAAPARATSTASEPGGEETVLLVEDEGAVRLLVADVLRRRGYRVITAMDGEEAIEAAHRHAGVLHLLITDIVMPGMTGRELARFLVRERPGLRVLFISGYSDQRTEPRESQGGAFLQKPFTPAALSLMVRQLLDSPAPGPAGE